MNGPADGHLDAMPGGKSGHGLGRKGALADGAACGKGGVDSMPGAEVGTAATMT